MPVLSDYQIPVPTGVHNLREIRKLKVYVIPCEKHLIINYFGFDVGIRAVSANSLASAARFRLISHGTSKVCFISQQDWLYCAVQNVGPDLNPNHLTL